MGVHRLHVSSSAELSRVLTESREINAIDGTSVSRKHLSNSPVNLGGVFNGGLVAVSKGEMSCMRYMLQPTIASSSDKSYVV